MNDHKVTTGFNVFISAVQHKLTIRELMVFEFLLLGLSVSEIARKTNRSCKTVSSHKVSIYQKLKVKNDLLFFKEMILLGVVTHN